MWSSHSQWEHCWAELWSVCGGGGSEGEQWVIHLDSGTIKVQMKHWLSCYITELHTNFKFHPSKPEAVPGTCVTSFPLVTSLPSSAVLCHGNICYFSAITIVLAEACHVCSCANSLATYSAHTPGGSSYLLSFKEMPWVKCLIGIHKKCSSLLLPQKPIPFLPFHS